MGSCPSGPEIIGRSDDGLSEMPFCQDPVDDGLPGERMILRTNPLGEGGPALGLIMLLGQFELPRFVAEKRKGTGLHLILELGYLTPVKDANHPGLPLVGLKFPLA